MVRAIIGLVLILAGSTVVTASADASSRVSGVLRAVHLPTGGDAGSKQSVAYQVDIAHTGDAAGTLVPPLSAIWAVNLGGAVGYPVVVNGVVVVAANGSLIALHEKTGKVIWSQPAPTGGGWIGPAYDNGMIFSNVLYTNGSQGIGMYAFALKTGKQLWSAVLPGQYAFSSPPTASNGIVYTGGAGSGGTVYAFSESNGQLLWTAQVQNGDDSSPAVSPTGVYVSYACPQTYDFNPTTGAQIWYYSGPCEGGGGSTGVLYDNLYFVEDSSVVNGYNGIVLTANSGQPAGNFNSNYPPAFAHHIGFFVTNGQTLVAASVPKLTPVWTATINSSDSYATPPLIVGGTVYIETASGQLLGYALRTGKVMVQMSLGYSDSSPGFSRGLGYGSHDLIVPADSELIALRGS
ncbi:MAG: PQQ-binding-like beta-propeller repeat protein [Candidatus Eremiobacteraeota bacterium]|nr:PQQ-binding-like beta-propeller repeat protein [Candidatus Eremiobacteraeota bacterium]